MTRWKCANRKYEIRRIGYTSKYAYQNSDCKWNTEFQYKPSDLECVISYCDNPTTAPNSPHNYNYIWYNNVIPINSYINFPCKNNHAVEQDRDWKSEAATWTAVKCQSDGEFAYPTSWPQCSTTITCADPGDSAGVTRQYVSSNVDLDYASVFQYTCDDPRKWIKLSSEADTSLAAYRNNTCQWRKTYQHDGTDFVCVINHCRHPHDEPGSHSPPPVENQITLETQPSWTVQFGDFITYKCPTGTRIEDNGDDPTRTQIKVYCISGQGEYDIPRIKQDYDILTQPTWPNCTETVVCGQPPEPDVNVTRTWVDAPDNQDTYDTHLTYRCQDGSQFDTDGDGAGDSVEVGIRCLWNKNWSPYPVIPPCIVTHCVEPFKIPDYTNLEAVTDAWTPINTKKQYR